MVDIKQLIAIAYDAGSIVMSIYNQPSFAVSEKPDHSALTEADTASHDFICAELQKYYPDIPVISEECTDTHDYAVRRNWEYFFLVDPLDGTKEFIKRNGEFTINIALIKNQQPVSGVIYQPAADVMYYAVLNQGAHKIAKQVVTKLPLIQRDDYEIRVLMSRSHLCDETEMFVENLRGTQKKIVAVSAGSALKFGLIAEGSADIYPRFSPTMEWDTAAGQILVSEVGKKMLVKNSNQNLQYNKLSLKNPGFIVE